MFDDDQDDDFEKTSILTSVTLKKVLDNAGKIPPSLVLLVGPPTSIGKQWSLEDTAYDLGRAPKCSVFVNDRSISNSHAKILIEGDKVYIMDLESTNSTFINNIKIEPMQPTLLSHNAQIKTGNVIFKYLERGSLESITNKKSFDRGQYDTMTQIYNKGALMSYIPEAFKRSDLTDQGLSLIMFDIDHFKKVNDTYGHAAGDYVITQIARLVKDKLIRAEDFFARYGGEEYALVLSGTPIELANQIAERIRETINDYDFMFSGVNINIAISLGVSYRPPKGAGWSELFDSADKALYYSKENGRNRVTIGDIAA